jgi:glucose-6-phosphate isomerase
MASVPSGTEFSPAIAAMAALEAGAIANPDEGRRVGHYWLRDPDSAPTAEITTNIKASWKAIEAIDMTGFDTVLMIGIGGSALGPALAIEALSPSNGRRFLLIDTIDPSAIQDTLEQLEHESTLVIVASKSGKTRETLAATQIVKASFATQGVDFSSHAVAITGPNSPLASDASGWRSTLLVWDWVGGRTSICSAIGLLPMHLCGIDFRAFLKGAKEMDAWTRQAAPHNPAAQLAALWSDKNHHTAAILPYCDRLASLTRYLQQLVMESLGKDTDRAGRTRHAGLTVFGNKGSADQHALVQQLRCGPKGVVTHFVAIDAKPHPEPLDRQAQDLLFALMTGTRNALHQVDRPAVSISLPALDPRRLGALIALFERTVGLTAELLNLNAYHQPGVEAGKHEATRQLSLLSTLEKQLGPHPSTAQELSDSLGLDVASTWRLAQHLSLSGRARIISGNSVFEDRFYEI